MRTISNGPPNSCWPYAARSGRWRGPAGVDFGTVWAGIRGGVERNEYGVAGNVVILACRLFVMAPWQEILVSRTIYDRLQRNYELTDLGRRKIKGRSEPKPVYRLDAVRATAAVDVTTDRALVGRAEELAHLQSWIRPIFGGDFGGVIYIDGEAGIGKSRLVGELQQHLHEEQELLWLACPTDALLQQSLHPFRQALQSYFGPFDATDPEQHRARFEAVLNQLIDQLAGPEPNAEGKSDQQAELAQELDRVRSVLAALLNIRWAGSFYEQLEPQLRFDNTLSALKSFFKALAARRPVMLHLEDAHWLDDDSVQALQMLTRNMAGVPLVLLVTTRFQDDGSALRLPVG